MQVVAARAAPCASTANSRVTAKTATSRAACRPAAAGRPFAPRTVAPHRRGRLSLARAAPVDHEAAAKSDRVPQWDYVYYRLKEAGLESVSGEDALAMVNDGKAVLVDVRPKERHEEAHPTGAKSAPAFRNLELSDNFSVGKLLKFVATKSQGVKPMESNPAFLEQVKAAAADKKVILMCEAGGTLESTVSFPTGKSSRSLIACWKTIFSKTLPADRVLHLEGGAYKWYKQGLPMTGEYDPSAAGSTPAVAEKPTGAYFPNSEQK